jgi:PhzF family phenazine biosynthesis protein
MCGLSVNVEMLTVFADGPGGGNPCPVVTDADGLSDEQMRAVAQEYGHESAFVLTPTDPRARVRLRYFVPRHEMEMCVHATVAALSLFGEPGALLVQTPLGLVNAEVGADGMVTVEQFPPVFGAPVHATHELAAAMGCGAEQVLAARSVSVSRAKLMVDVTGLQALQPDPDAVRRVCEQLDVTGLYPFMAGEGGQVSARQFPRDSGYPEDPATGLAAAGLACLLAMRENADGQHSYDIHQGQAMGRPSRIMAHTTRVGGTVTRVAVSGRAERRERVR